MADTNNPGAAISTPSFKMRTAGVSDYYRGALLVSNPLCGQGAQSSPTSTTMSDSVSFHPVEESIAPAFLHVQNTGFLGSRKTVIRADPALVTCFDPADKYLYDLWAPKN